MLLLISLGFAGFSSALALRAPDPLVTLIAQDLAVTPQTAALLSSAFALPYALSQPILGPLGDAIGKRLVTRLCLVVLAIALVMNALASSFALLIAARIASGAAAGGVIPLSMAVIGDRFPVAERRVAISRFIVAVIMGQMAGGMMSGVLGEVFGWRIVFIVCTIMALIGFAASFAIQDPLGGPQRRPLSLTSMKQGYQSVFAHPLTFACYGAVLCEGILVFGLFPYVAYLLEVRQAGGPSQAGFVLSGVAVGGILFSILIRWLLNRLGPYDMMRAGGIIAGLGLTGAAFAPSWPLEAACFILIGFGFYMFHNALQTQATELAPEARGSAVALFAFFFFLGQSLGPVLFGAGLSLTGTIPVALTAATCMVILSFVTARRFSQVR